MAGKRARRLFLWISVVVTLVAGVGVASLLVIPIAPRVEVRTNAEFSVFPDRAPLPLLRDGEWHVMRFRADTPGTLELSNPGPGGGGLGIPRFFSGRRAPPAIRKFVRTNAEDDPHRCGYDLASGVAGLPDGEGGGLLVPYFDVSFFDPELPSFGVMLRAEGVQFGEGVLRQVRITTEALDRYEHTRVDRVLGRPTIRITVTFPPEAFAGSSGAG